ncbi:spore germination protein gerPA/gerPF [Thermincola ferriacetica]|uniref:Spore germination protein gerPA/gerPF n=2 Tax=Thermincola TaxID=278993 RepID=D5XA00_THEPJ|nr:MULTISPECIES: spore germination protein [Thermincola]ADG83133.1 Spore germination protein gerPA/gerPF [Thermincola potens JR]KNZ70621.1 spore germination protein gerPA/gerPF [Thermincola ferriacetica]
MPGFGVVINIGAFKINSMTGTASVNIGDNLITTPQSVTKNLVAGPFSAGDGTLNNAPSTPVFSDPDVIDSSTVRPVSVS